MIFRVLFKILLNLEEHSQYKTKQKISKNLFGTGLMNFFLNQISVQQLKKVILFAIFYKRFSVTCSFCKDFLLHSLISTDLTIVYKKSIQAKSGELGS